MKSSSSLLVLLLLVLVSTIIMTITITHGTVEVEEDNDNSNNMGGEDEATSTNQASEEQKEKNKRAVIIGRMRISSEQSPAEGQSSEAQITLWNVGNGIASDVKITLPSSLHEFGIDVETEQQKIQLELNELDAGENHNFNIPLKMKRAGRVPYSALVTALSYKTKEKDDGFHGQIYFDGGDLIIHSQAKAYQLSGDFTLHYLVYVLLTGGSGFLGYFMLWQRTSSSGSRNELDDEGRKIKHNKKG
jgi:hypothetical protein